MSPIIVIWLIVFVVSVPLGILLAKRIGSRLPLSVLVALSVFNLAGLAALVYLFTAPSKSGLPIERYEAEVFVYAEIAFVLIIILLLLLPPTLSLWVVRLRVKR